MDSRQDLRISTLSTASILAVPLTQGASLALLLVLNFRIWLSAAKDYFKPNLWFWLAMGFWLSAITTGLIHSEQLGRSARALPSLALGLLSAVSLLPLLSMTEATRQKALLQVCGAMLSVFLVGYLVTAYQVGFFLQRADGFDFFLSRNHMSRGIAFSLLGIFAVWLSISQAFRHWPSLLLIALGLFLLLASNTRGAFIAAVAAMGLMLFWHKSSIPVRIGAAMLASGITTALIISPDLAYQLGLRRTGTDFLSGRLPLWQVAWDYFLQHPLVGNGWDVFKRHPELNARLPDWLQNQAHPHNIYLETLFSTGLIGSLLLLSGFACWTRYLMNRFAGIDSVTMQALGLGLLSFILINGLVDLKLFSTLVMTGIFCAMTFMILGRKPRAIASTNP